LRKTIEVFTQVFTRSQSGTEMRLESPRILEVTITMPRRAEVPTLTGQQASYILGKLIDERRVSAADVRRHLAGMWQEMNFLEKRLSELRSMVGSVNPVRTAKKVVKRVVARAKRTAKTPEAAASRKLQAESSDSYSILR